MPWCFSARPCRLIGPGPVKKEVDDGIRETLWPARDGASAAQPAHDDARVEHRQRCDPRLQGTRPRLRSEEHTSELQSLMRISYAVFCLKKKTKESTQLIQTRHSTREYTNEYRIH